MMKKVFIFLAKKRHNHIDALNFCLSILAIAQNNWVAFAMIMVGFSLMSASLEKAVKPSN